MKLIAVTSMALFLTFMQSGCGTQIGISGQAREDYLKSIKPYIAYWQKEGMTEESRLKDWMACGGSRNGSFGINMQDRLPGESQGASQNRQQTDFQRCVLRAGYRYTGNCSSDWAKTRPACGAP